MQFLFQVIKKKWERHNNEWKITSVDLGFKNSMNFYNKLKWRQARSNFTCSVCDTKYDKGVTCIGNNYWNRICFNCVSKMNDTVQEDLNNLKKFFKNHKKEYDTNKTKWEKVAILSKLKSNGN